MLGASTTYSVGLGALGGCVTVVKDYDYIKVVYSELVFSF